MSKFRIRMDRSTYIQKLEQILADYMSIDDTELGEDKFTGHHNPAQAIKAIQALNEKAMPEEYEDYYATDPVRKGKKMGYNEAIRELKSIIGGDIDYE